MCCSALFYGNFVCGFLTRHPTAFGRTVVESEQIILCATVSEPFYIRGSRLPSSRFFAIFRVLFFPSKQCTLFSKPSIRDLLVISPRLVTHFDTRSPTILILPSLGFSRHFFFLNMYSFENSILIVNEKIHYEGCTSGIVRDLSV